MISLPRQQAACAEDGESKTWPQPAHSAARIMVTFPFLGVAFLIWKTGWPIVANPVICHSTLSPNPTLASAGSVG